MSKTKTLAEIIIDKRLDELIQKRLKINRKLKRLFK